VEKATISRAWIARGFTMIEDIVYVGLGLLLAASAIALLVNGLITLILLRKQGVGVAAERVV